MASFSEMKSGKFRASICVNRTRLTKVCQTLAAAKSWAAHAEARESGRPPAINKKGAELLLSMVPRAVLDAMTAVPFSKADVLRNALPYDIESGVYFLIRDGDVIYVGQSVNVMDRIAKHRREGRWFDSFNFLPCPRERLDELESQYILAFMPRMNNKVYSLRNKSLPTANTPTSAVAS